MKERVNVRDTNKKLLARNLVHTLMGGYRILDASPGDENNENNVFNSELIGSGNGGEYTDANGNRLEFEVFSTGMGPDSITLGAKSVDEGGVDEVDEESVDEESVDEESVDEGNVDEGPIVTAMIDINPRLVVQFPRPERKRDAEITSPRVEHPGVQIRSFMLKIGTASKGRLKVKSAGGKIALGIDMDGAVASKQDREFELERNDDMEFAEDVVYARMEAVGEHHFEGLSSGLDAFFDNRVTTVADLTDEGVRATLRVSAGPLGASVLRLQESEISATLGADGVQMEGDLGISDDAERVTGDLRVSWGSGGLIIEGAATVKELVPGLEPFTARITYDRAADGAEGLALGIDRVAFQRDLGAITVMGEAEDLQYDVKTGALSGNARLSSDLGALGEVAATAAIADNKLQRVDLAYETSPIELPRQNPIFSGNLESHLTYENDELSGTVGGTATLELPALQRLGQSDEPIAMSVEADVGGEGIGGNFTLLSPVQMGSYFRLTELGASLGGDGSIGMNGALELEAGVFEPARVAIAYQDGKLSGSGEVGIAEGAIPGVDRARIEVGIDGDRIHGSGTLMPSIRQIEEGAVSFSYSPTEGIAIGGSLALAGGNTFLKGAGIDFRVGKRPGVDTYDVSAGGTLDIEVPGLKVSAQASYDNGAFTIEGHAPYKVGKLGGGDVTLGVTNRLIDPTGKPTDQFGSELVPYGQGRVTLELTPWLRGTAGIRLLPNGELEVSGELAVPTWQFFRERTFEKKLLSLGLDIPILGGIFATIGGSLNLDAGVGPGTLRNARLGVTYNHARPEDTRISGGAAIHIPARAGLRLAIHGGVGAGIPLAKASLGLEASGRLGVEGALDAGIDLAWTPTKGVSFEATGRISAQPKLSFDLDGYVEAKVAFVWTDRKTWKLASFEYGPAMRLGMTFPISYDSERGLDMSWDRVRFEKPDIDIKSLLTGLIDKVT